MNTSLRYCNLLLLLFVVFTVGYGQNSFYVSTSGNDANPGTELLPWKTFQKAFDAATPGSTVYIRGGVYNEKTTVNVSGTAEGGFITFRNYGSDTAILDGTGKTGDQLILIEDKSYLRFIGFELRNNLNQTFGSGIWVKGSGKYIELRQNKIHDMRRTGTGDCMAISVYGTALLPLSNIVIDSNVIYDCEPGYSEAVTLNGNVDTFRVSNNLVHDVNNIGIDMIGGENTAPSPAVDVVRNGICSGNTVYNAHSLYGGGYAAGIYVDGGMNIIVERNTSSSNDVGIEIGCENQGRITSGIIVRNNLVFDNEKRGIGVGGYNYPSTGKVTTTSVLNNTCFNNDTYGTDEGELTVEYTENCTFKNNIFYSNTGNRLMVSTVGNSSGNVFDYNVWYAPGGSSSATIDYHGDVYTGFSSYQSGTGQDAHSNFVNPLFVSTVLPLPDLHLQEGSPALDAGDPAFVPASGETDRDGNARLTDLRVDCGAYEMNQIVLLTPSPVEPEDAAGISSSPLTFRWTSSDSGVVYQLQVSASILFSSFVVNDSLLTDTVVQKEMPQNGIYYWRVRAKKDEKPSAWSERWSFTFISPNHWKIVSVPLQVSDGRTTVVYPTAISHAFAFQPGAGYVMHDTLEPGIGYWLKFGGDETSVFSGDSIFTDTISVVAGWNLVGSISVPVPVSSVATEPPGLLSGGFFGYTNRYINTETILPAEGYWVKVSEAGILILSGSH